jgi:photosystem II stability/assembly factor-like uncharacterized protein
MRTQSRVFAAVAGTFGHPDTSSKVGVFRRDPRLGEWQHPLSELASFSVMVHPADAALVLAGTDDGVWRSHDGGNSFKRTDFPSAGQQIWCFLVDACNPDCIYAGGSPLAVYRSDDAGTSWQRLPDIDVRERLKAPFPARVMRLAQNPNNPAEIYAALEINGIIRTADAGRTWQDCSTDLIRLSQQPHLRSKIVSDTFAEGMLDAHAIAISAAEPHTAIAALRTGLFRTTTAGVAWDDLEIRRFSPVTYGRDVQLSPHDPKTLYAALSEAAQSQNGAVYRSRDLGLTWHRFDNIQVHGTIMSIALDRHDPQQVHVAARYHGEVFSTDDDGHSWSSITLPQPVRDIYCLACG